MAESTDTGGGGGRITEDLRNFYAQHGIDVDRLQAAPNDDDEEGEANNLCFASRFIRLNPAVDIDETLSKLKNELKNLPKSTSSTKECYSSSLQPMAVPWLDERLGFYALPGEFKLSQSQCYQEGRIYGMDVSSGAAVAALISNQYDKDFQAATSPDSAASATASTPTSPSCRVLDLCCAPGLKLCALADYLASTTTTTTRPAGGSSVVVGVDVSEHRIATTKRILHKYRMQTTTKERTSIGAESTSSNDQEGEDPPSVRIRLYCGDGTTFDRHDNVNQLPNLVFDSQTAKEQSAVSGKRKRMNKSAKARERKRLKSLATIDFYQNNNNHNSYNKDEEQGSPTTCQQEQHHGSSPLQKKEGTNEETSKATAASASAAPWIAHPFDYVLVDAECSTDGSLKHIQKQINNSPDTGASSSSSSSKEKKETTTNTIVAPLLVDQTKLEELVQLQKRLAAAGFRMLKPGGSMIYSTCSLSDDQNENVVKWLLQEEFPKDAYLIPLDFTSTINKKKKASDSDDKNDNRQHNKKDDDEMSNPKIKEGQWGVRFEPNLPKSTKTTAQPESTATEGSQNMKFFFGGGFFLAKIGKRRAQTPCC